MWLVADGHGSGNTEYSTQVSADLNKCLVFVVVLIVSNCPVCQNWGSCFWHLSGMTVMAKKSVNKSALVRDYLAKYPEKGPTAIAKQIAEEHRVKLTGKYVATVKTKLKLVGGSSTVASPSTAPAVASSIPTIAASKPAKKETSPSQKSNPLPPSPHQHRPVQRRVPQHIANLKAAAHQLGKDEAKKIIDLF